MSKATERRIAAINAILEPSNALANSGATAEHINAVTDWVDVAQQLANLAPLGRTQRWIAACEWFQMELDEAAEEGTLTIAHARWIVFQGTVYLGCAA